MKKLRDGLDPMMVLAVAVLLGVIGMAVAGLVRAEPGLSAEETALLSAIVGAVAGASLPRSASKDDKGEGQATEEDPLLGTNMNPVDPGMDEVSEPEFGTEDDDFFDDDDDEDDFLEEGEDDGEEASKNA